MKALTWLPSPISSPPIPPDARRRIGDERQGAGLGEGFRPTRGGRGIGVRTPSSSSVPAEAIQAEVQRQMGSLLNRMSEVENENARFFRELERERSKQREVPHEQPSHS